MLWRLVSSLDAVDGFLYRGLPVSRRSLDTSPLRFNNPVTDFTKSRAPSFSVDLRRSLASNMMFERMSEDCIAALLTAQEQGKGLDLKKIGTEVMLAGIVDNPETRSVSRTLNKYGITWRKIQKTLNEMYSEKDGSPSRFSLGGLKKSSNKDDSNLPFADELKRAMKNAGSLADQMGSETINTHHMLLGLLEYREAGGEQKAAALNDQGNCECGALAVILRSDGVDPDLQAIDICLTLLQNIEELSVSDGDSRELVTGVGGSDKTPTLEDCGVDLTQQARDGLLDPVHGRDTEIQACVRALVRRRKNNVCLIGEAGVGKTAIAEGIAQMLVDNPPPRLSGYRLVSIEMATLVAGTKYRGEFEERLQGIIEEVCNPKAPPTILFLDEIHNLVGAGSAEGGMDAANLLKPALARGQLQVVGATTFAEYRKYIEKDAALERRLQPVKVKEPSVPETVQILRAIQKNYETHHGVVYTPGSLEAAATLAERYINDRFLPDKAIDVLDEAGAVVHLENAYRDPDSDIPVVTESTMARIISDWANVPVGKMEAEESRQLQTLEEDISGRVKGQERAVRAVARAIRRSRSGLQNPGRPISCFLFCGPTGTGKTELCKTLSESYFGSEKDMIRMDMSEYMEKHSVSRLIGPPPGYIGYEEGGQLTEAVRRKPHSTVLLDEIEKAHGDVLNILLQIMEDGILTDGKGRTVSFKNCIVVMTSNIGSKRILEIARNKMSRDDVIETESEYSSSLHEDFVEVVMEELEFNMRPEFLNRIDEITVFSPLSRTHLSGIAELMIGETVKRAHTEQNIELKASPRLVLKVLDEGSANVAQFGARPMRRAAQRYFEDTVSEAIVQRFLENGDSAEVDFESSTNDSKTPTVLIIRQRDGETMKVIVDESSGGIGQRRSTRKENVAIEISSSVVG